MTVLRGTTQFTGNDCRSLLLTNINKQSDNGLHPAPLTGSSAGGSEVFFHRGMHAGFSLFSAHCEAGSRVLFLFSAVTSILASF